MVGVRRYAAAYKTSVPQRSVDSVTTDASVFAAQAAWARGLHDTAVASARYLLRWVETSAPSSASSSHMRPLEVTDNDAKMAQSAFEDALLATVCMYTGFLEHETLPVPLEAAVEEMEANLSTAASSFDGLAVLLRIGHCAVQHVENRRLAAVDQATVVYGLLRKFAHAVEAARNHQERYGKEWEEERFRRTTWDTTIILIKTHLLTFKLAVAISGLFVNEIRRYRDFSQDENPKPSNADIRSVEYGGWGDKAREAFWDAVDLMLSVAQEHGVGVLTRVESDAEETDAEASEAEMDEEEEESDEDDDAPEDETDIEASDDEPAGLDQTLLAQLLLTFMRLREVMEGVWDNHSSEQFEASFDRFSQPPVYEEVTEGDGSVRMVPTAERDWEGWDKLGVELCRGMSRAELAEFEEHNLDSGMHKRWRARLRDETRRERPRRSLSSEKRRAEDSDDEGGRAKRRKSYR